MAELIDRYLDGDMSEQEAEDFLVLLEEDPQLEAELRAYEQMLSEAAQADLPDPSTGFTDRVMGRVHAASAEMASRQRRGSGLSPWLPKLAWAASVALVFGAGYLAAQLGAGARISGGPGAQSSPVAGTVLPASALQSAGPRYVRLVYIPEHDDVGQVCVAGSFNGWNPSQTPMQREGEYWTTILVLPPDTYEYMFVEDGEHWRTDPMAVKTRDDGFGHANAVLELAL